MGQYCTANYYAVHPIFQPVYILHHQHHIIDAPCDVHKPVCVCPLDGVDAGLEEFLRSVLTANILLLEATLE